MTELAHAELRHVAILHRRSLKRLERRLAPLALGPGRYLYLFALYLEDGRSQQSLADAVSADKAAATRALARLEADGYVRRSADASDRRVSRVFLTAKGLALRGVLEEAAREVNDALLAPLAPRERDTLRELLHRMTRALPED